MRQHAKPHHLSTTQHLRHVSLGLRPTQLTRFISTCLAAATRTICLSSIITGLVSYQATAFEAGTEMPIISLDLTSNELNCEILLRIIQFADRYQVSPLDVSSFQRKLKRAESFVSFISSNLDPLNVYLHEAEYADVSSILKAFVRNPSPATCAELDSVSTLYAQGALNYLNAIKHMQPPALSVPPRISLDSLGRPPTDAKARQQRIQKLQHFEHYYLTLATKLSGGTATIPHYKYIDQFYTSGNFGEYTEQLFSKQRMFTLFIKSYLAAIDPYSNFYADFEFIQSPFYPRSKLKNHNVGVGITAKQPYGFLTIQTVINQSPAYKLGKLKSNDIIIAIYDKLSQGYVSSFLMQYGDMVRLLRGKNNSTLKMLVVSQATPHHNHGEHASHAPEAEPSFDLRCEEIELKRQPIALHPNQVKSQLLTTTTSTGAPATVGYLKPSKFYRSYSQATGKLESSVTLDLIKSLRAFNNAGLEALILDLRDNSGGHFLESVATGRLFSDELDLRIEGSLNTSYIRRNINQARRLPRLYDGPLVIVVNEATASAAEVLAHSLRVQGRALVVGSARTVGKSMMQSLIYLNKSDPYFGSFLISTHLIKSAVGSSLPSSGLASDITIRTTPPADEVAEPQLTATNAPLSRSLIDRLQRNSNHRYHRDIGTLTSHRPYHSLFSSNIRNVCHQSLAFTTPPPDAHTLEDKVLAEAMNITTDYVELLAQDSFM